MGENVARMHSDSSILELGLHVSVRLCCQNPSVEGLETAELLVRHSVDLTWYGCFSATAQKMVRLNTEGEWRNFWVRK